MTGADFRAARLSLGLTQVQMARILSTAPITIGRWEADDSLSTSRKVNPIAARVMEWMLDGFEPPEMR